MKFFIPLRTGLSTRLPLVLLIVSGGLGCQPGSSTDTPTISAGGLHWFQEAEPLIPIPERHNPDFQRATEARKEKADEPVPRVQPVEMETNRRVQWLMFSASWCPPCRKAKADFVDWLRASQ